MTDAATFHCVLRRDTAGRVAGVALIVLADSRRLREVVLNGHRGVRVVGPLHDLLRTRGVGAGAWAGAAPMELDNDTGAQVDLLLRAVGPLRRGDRIDAVAEGVAAMGREEAAYWHAKAARRSGMRALRLLLGDSV